MKREKKRVSVTLDAEVVEALKEVAAKDSRSLSQYINRQMKLHLGLAEKKGGTVCSRL